MARGANGRSSCRQNSVKDHSGRAPRRKLNSTAFVSFVLLCFLTEGTKAVAGNEKGTGYANHLSPNTAFTEVPQMKSTRWTLNDRRLDCSRANPKGESHEVTDVSVRCHSGGDTD